MAKTEAEDGLPGDHRQHADHDAEQQPEYRQSPASAHSCDLPRVSRRPTDGRSATAFPIRMSSRRMDGTLRCVACQAHSRRRPPRRNGRDLYSALAGLSALEVDPWPTSQIPRIAQPSTRSSARRSPQPESSDAPFRGVSTRGARKIGITLTPDQEMELEKAMDAVEGPRAANSGCR